MTRNRPIAFGGSVWEGADLGPCDRIILDERQKHTDPPNAINLLRVYCERPRRRAAEKRNELTSPHIRTKLRGQHCIGSNEYFDRGSNRHQNHCRGAQLMSLMGLVSRVTPVQAAMRN